MQKNKHLHMCATLSLHTSIPGERLRATLALLFKNLWHLWRTWHSVRKSNSVHNAMRPLKVILKKRQKEKRVDPDQPLRSVASDEGPLALFVSYMMIITNRHCCRKSSLRSLRPL